MHLTHVKLIQLVTAKNLQKGLLVTTVHVLMFIKKTKLRLRYPLKMIKVEQFLVTQWCIKQSGEANHLDNYISSLTGEYFRTDTATASSELTP